MDMYSYVVRYDSGFAPNPFYRYCTLATCKPRIRKNTKIGDWVVGVGSANKKVNQGGKLVHVMKVTEILSLNEYFEDDRFQNKKPVQTGSKKQARGDNIYYKVSGKWTQLDSFHSQEDGSPKEEHVARDTKVNRVLISDEYTYFGAYGPLIPDEFTSQGKSLCHKGISESKFSNCYSHDSKMINDFFAWLKDLGASEFVGHPYDWSDSQ